jgi:hypothetical protein
VLKISFHNVRWVSDATIEGAARWDLLTGTITALLTVHVAGAPPVHLAARWLQFGQQDQPAVVAGSQGSAHGTSDPTANMQVWTATPSSPVRSSRATIEYVTASPPSPPVIVPAADRSPGCAESSGPPARSVVVTGRNDDDLFVRDDVDEAVLVIDPSRPGPGQVVPQRLGFANAGERIPADVLDELVDPG